MVAEIGDPHLIILPVIEDARGALDHALGSLDDAFGRHVAVVIHIENQNGIAGVIGDVEFTPLGIDGKRRGPVQLGLRAADDPERGGIPGGVARVDRNRGFQIPAGAGNRAFAQQRPIRLVRAESPATVVPCSGCSLRLHVRGDGAEVGYKHQVARGIDRQAVGIGDQGLVALERSDGRILLRSQFMKHHDGRALLRRQEQLLVGLVHRNPVSGVRGADNPLGGHIAALFPREDHQPVNGVVVDGVNIAIGLVNVERALEFHPGIQPADHALGLAHGGGWRSVLRAIVSQDLERGFIRHHHFIIGNIYRDGAVSCKRVLDYPDRFARIDGGFLTRRGRGRQAPRLRLLLLQHFDKAAGGAGGFQLAHLAFHLR